ncbi:site-2 protease family protein [Patescibacteria group bacterium]|nr:site-2 protease family protein [Patescibacteria group bacterium]MBU2259984.1 site-2 protease family protein [Patescibacteria group bacterium]
MSPFISPPFIIAILIAISVHEWGHGFVAYKLGDPTAQMDGRLSLNPLAHLDPIGTLMFLIIGFGWAKPVPIDPRYFKNHKRDTTLVALAGPATNLITAFICFFILTFILNGGVGTSAMGLLGEPTNGSVIITLLERILGSCIFVNLALMAFNLLPIAPLDGSKILNAFIPYKYEREYALFMQRGPMILLILILAGMFLNIPILSTWVFGIMQPILALMGVIAGIF